MLDLQGNLLKVPLLQAFFLGPLVSYFYDVACRADAKEGDSYVRCGMRYAA